MAWNITDAGTLENAVFKLKLEIAHKIDVQKGMEVVDLGCGQGGFTAAVARTVGRHGKICMIEPSTLAEKMAEGTYIRLHRESGDSLFEPDEIVETMTRAGLKKVSFEKIKTDIWFSPALARQDLGFAQVWYDNDVEKTLGSLISKFGMKYPALMAFSGTKY